MNNKNELHPDVVLIGAGIMSATLGIFLKKLQPEWTIEIFERLDEVAGESSDAWNNAGTGHSAFCELNYTPENADGSIDIAKAIKIAEQFEVSKEFWASLVREGIIDDPQSFINDIPHMSLVWGEENVAYLKRRHAALMKHHFFSDMQFSEDNAQLAEWMPLVMQGREINTPLAATRMEIGTDVNFGALTRILFRHLEARDGVHMHCAHEVRDIDQDADGYWYLNVKDLKNGRRRTLRTPFVFIGAGGGALHLLEKSDIPEAKGFGGFPVSGQWLVCNNVAVIEQHAAKVYGKASVGAPPMSVPHLDTRIINGRKALLFGPYAGFSTKFLKKGSLLDLPGSINFSNLRPMLSAGLHNIPLTRYLLDQVTQSAEDRLETLQEFVPTARMEDWDLEVAGQRVQVIKKDKDLGGILEFGTELVTSADGSISALLGASPGASTAVAIMLGLLERCFPQKIKTEAWQQELKRLIPSYGQSLAKDKALAEQMRRTTSEVLQLNTEA
jgi:malate dehydrogenase (quinone)